MAKTTATTKPAPKAAEPKLDAKTINQLQELGINATTDSTARSLLLAILTENGIEDADNDSIPELIQMAAVFVNSADAVTADTEEAEEEEVVAPVKGKAKGAKGKQAEAEMDELAEEVTATGKDKAVASGKKSAAAPKKKASTSDGGRRKLLGKRWEDLTEKEKEVSLAPFIKRLPVKKFGIEVLQRSFTVKFLGESSAQNIFKYHLLRRLDDGKLEGIFVAHRFKTPDEFSQFLSDELVKTRTLKKGDSCSYIHPLRQDEVFEILDDTDFLKLSIEAAAKQDKKMKDNRAKLEDQLEEAETTTAPVKAAGKGKAKAAAAPADEEEEEVVVAAPVKGKAAAAPVKKVTAPKPAPAKVAPAVAAKLLPKVTPPKAAAKKK